MFFSLSSAALGAILFSILIGCAIAGTLLGRRLRSQGERWREPIGVILGALLGLVGLILAFSLSMAVGRYEERRTEVVAEANDIGTTYLRAQTLPDPARASSLSLLKRYAAIEIKLSHARPNSAAERALIASGSDLQRQLWSLAVGALRAEPTASAPRLYVESLNAMIDAQTSRVAALRNRVPNGVLVVEVLGAGTALALMALYVAVAIRGRGQAAVALATLFTALLLVVTFDLDRPTRGFISISDAPLTQLAASMNE